MPKLSLAKLERHLYSAADRLRQEGLDNWLMPTRLSETQEAYDVNDGHN